MVVGSGGSSLVGVKINIRICMNHVNKEKEKKENGSALSALSALSIREK